MVPTLSLLHAAMIQKLAEQLSQQERKLSLLQKKVDNASLVADDMRNAYLSLEGKVGEDNSRQFQSFLKGKSKQDLKMHSLKTQNKFLSDIVSCHLRSLLSMR
jgi:N-glycosylase/DNA lyase